MTGRPVHASAERQIGWAGRGGGEEGEGRSGGCDRLWPNRLWLGGPADGLGGGLGWAALGWAVLEWAVPGWVVLGWALIGAKISNFFPLSNPVFKHFFSDVFRGLVPVVWALSVPKTMQNKHIRSPESPNVCFTWFSNIKKGTDHQHKTTKTLNKLKKFEKQKKVRKRAQNLGVCGKGVQGRGCAGQGGRGEGLGQSALGGQLFFWEEGGSQTGGGDQLAGGR